MMNVFPYYLLGITVQMSVQKCVKECLDPFFVLTRLSNLIVQARRAFRVRYRPVSTRGINGRGWHRAIAYAASIVIICQ